MWLIARDYNKPNVYLKKQIYYHNTNWQVLCEYDYDGQTESLNYWYAYGNTIDEPLIKNSSKSANTAQFYAQDHLTSTAALLDSTGAVIERYEYNAYGEPNILDPDYTTDEDQISDYDNNVLFTGRRVDIFDNGSLKIQYNRNRYYSYNMGRWLSQDPLRYVDGLNLYEYIGNNPIYKSDSLGLSWSWLDFVDHYYGKSLYPKGHTINLASPDVDLLNTFMNAPSVKSKVSEFKLIVFFQCENARKKELHSLNKSTNIKGSSNTVTDVTKEIYSLGHSSFFREYNCDVNLKCKDGSWVWSFKCQLLFYIRDRFEDILGIGIELGGTPYGINADWTEDYAGDDIW